MLTRPAECASLITVPNHWWEDIKWQTNNLWVGAPNNWARAALMWSLAADSNGVSGNFPSGIIIFTRLFRVHYSLVPVPVEAEKVSAAGA